MFERFTTQARETVDVLGAVRRLRGTSELDAAALESIGIDLDAVREKVEAAFGAGALDGPRGRPRKRGHIPFSPRARKVLELSLREAIRLRQRQIADGHLLLGVLRDGNGLAARIIAETGADFATLRAQVEDELR